MSDPVSGNIDLIGATIAAFGTLLVYDVFFVTFYQEVELVWPTRWSYGKILFLLNRYLPFFDTFLSLHLLVGTNTDQECLMGFKAVTWLIVVGILIAEVILMIRTYALWERKRSILIFLIVLGVVLDIPAIVITQLEVDTFHYTAVASGGCSKTSPSSTIIFVAFLLLIISETTIVVLTMIKAWTHYRHSRSALLVRMYKDGLLYYIYLLAFSLVNVIIAVAAPPEFANWLTTPQRVIHSLLCTRVLLHIRSFSFKSNSNTSAGYTDTSLSFAPGAGDATSSNQESSQTGTSSSRSGTKTRSTSSSSRSHGFLASFLSTQSFGTSSRSHDEAIELQPRSVSAPEIDEVPGKPVHLSTPRVRFLSEVEEGRLPSLHDSPKEEVTRQDSDVPNLGESSTSEL